MKKILILFLVLIFLPLKLLIADDNNFKIIHPGEKFYEFGLSVDGKIIYKDKVIVDHKYDYATNSNVYFSRLGIYKPYKNTIFFYASSIDEADHGFLDMITGKIDFKYPGEKWFLANPAGYSYDGRYIFTLGDNESWPIVKIIDLEEKNYLDFYGDFESYNFQEYENSYVNVEVYNFKIDAQNNFSYTIEDKLANKTYQFKSNVKNYKVLKTEPYNLNIDQENINLNTSGQNNIPPQKSKKNNSTYIFLGILVVGIVSSVALKMIQRKNNSIE